MSLLNRPDTAAVLFFFWVVFVFVVIDAKECSTKCEEGDENLEGFLKGHSYMYTFDGFSKIHLNGARAQNTNASLHAVITVYSLGDCSHVLKITHLTFFGPNGTKYEGPQEITKPVRFSIQNGNIGKEFCTEKGDSQISLNIKRAIISMLQSSEEEKIEVDIFGECYTKLFIDGNFIQKRKNLNTCAKRVQAEETFLQQFRNAESAFKTSHVMEASFKIDMKINSGIVEKAESREDYFFLPFSSKRAGAKAIVTSSLRLTGTSIETLNVDCPMQKSIIFESRPAKASNGNEKSIHDAVLFVTEHLQDHVQLGSPSVFVDLIRVLKLSTKNDILKVFDTIENEIENKNLMRKVFIDALVRTATSDSIRASIELMKRELDPMEKRIILSSFSAVKHVTFDMVKAVTGLLTWSGLPYDAYLNVGAIAGSYCKEHSCYSLSKSKREFIVSITDFLVPKLQNCKANSKGNETKIISALRALKNINHIEDKALNTLIVCAIDKTITPRIRAATLETFTAAPCLNRLKLVSLGILKDVEEDSELRIKAYLALLQCPTSRFATVVQNILNDPNPSLQVGAFISSSLKNILDSNDPSREETKKLFNRIAYKNSFPVDARKYSQAYEMNYNNVDYGMKSSVRSDVIYSQNSFLPRSLNMNITANIFGMDVNLLEIGFRQGNLDSVLEDFFGPEGKFQTYTPKTMYDNFRQSAYSAYDKIRERMKRIKHRTKKDTRNQITDLGTKLKTNVGEYGDSLDIDISVKLFGSESVFLSLGESTDSYFEALVDRFMNSIDVSSTDSDKFMNDVRIHTLFLDTELTYPTMTGMALKLNVEGASTGKVTFDENWNIRQLFGDATNTKIEIKLMPSASIQIVGSLSTDADLFVTGLKVAATLHSSTGIELSGEFSDDIKGFKTDVAFPLEQQEFLTATSEIMFFTRQRGKNAVQNNLKFSGDSNDQECMEHYSFCFVTNHSFLSSLFGKRNLNKPAFLLSGHKKLMVYIRTPKKKKFLLNGSSGINGTVKFWKVMFSAQDPTDETGMGIRIDTDDNELLSMKILVEDPESRTIYTNTLMNTPVEKSLTINKNDNPQRHPYTLKIGVMIEQLGSKTAYRPMVNFMESGNQYIKTEGVIYLEQNGGKYKYVIDKVGYYTPYSKAHMNGWSQIEPRGLSWFFNVTTDENKFLWSNGKVFHDNEEALGNMYIDFQNDDEDEFNFWFERSHNTSRNLDGSIHYDGKYVFIYGPDRNTKTNIVTYTTQSTIDNNKEFIYHFKHELTFPYLTLKHRGEVEYKDEKKINIIFFAEFKQNNIDLFLVLDNGDTNSDEKYATLKVVVNKFGGEILLSIKNESEEKTKISTHILVLPNDKYEIEVMIEAKPIADDNEIVISGHLQFPNIEIFIFDIGFISTPKIIVSHVFVTRNVQKYFDFDAIVNLEMNFGKMTLDINDVAVFKGVCVIDPPHGKITASLNVNLIKFDRVIQFESECTYSQPKYTAELKIFTDYSKDPSRVFRITTVTFIKNSDVKSKNVLFHSGKQTMFNFNIKQIGAIENGRMKYDLELIRPGGATYILIYNKEIGMYENLSNSTIDFTLQKTIVNAAGPVKFTSQFKKVNYNERKSMGMMIFNSTYVRENGDDIVFRLQTFSEDKKKGKVAEVTTNLSGSMVQNKIDFFWWQSSKYALTNRFEYKIRANYGENTSILGSGSVCSDLGILEKYDVNANIEARLPIENFKTIKINTKNHAEFFSKQRYQCDVKTLNFSMDATVNDNNYLYDYKFDINDTFFSTSLKFNLQDKDPFRMAFYRNFLSNENDKNTTDLEFSASLYGQNVNYTLNNIRLLSPGIGGEFKNILILPEFTMYKIIKSHCIYNTQSLRKFRLTHDLEIDEKYNFTVNIDIDAHQLSSASMIELASNFPDSLSKRFLLKATVASEEFHTQALVQNFGDFNLALVFDGKIKSSMDFSVQMDIHCPKWNLVKYRFQAINAPPQSGEQVLTVSGSEDGKIILEAMAILNETKLEERVIVSGHGKLIWKSIEEQATFTFTQRLVDHGLYYVEFDGKVGTKSLHAVCVNIHKYFQVDVKQCDTTSTECAHFSTTSNTKRYRKAFNLLWDLNPYGFNTKFDLSADLNDDNKTPLSYKLDMNLERHSSHYNWVSNGSLIEKRYKTFTTIEIPNRTFSTETILLIDGAFSIGEIIFYWNVSDPDTKTHLKTKMRSYQAWRNQIFYKSIYFIYPGGQREMSIQLESNYDMVNQNASVSIDLDIFKLEDEIISFSGYFEPQFEYYYGPMNGFNTWLKIDGKGHRINYDMKNEVRYNKFYNITLDAISQLTVESQKIDNRLYLKLDSYKHQELIIEAPIGNFVDFTSSLAIANKNWPTGAYWNSSLKFFEDMNYYGEGKFSILDTIHTRLETGIVDPAESMFFEVLYIPRGKATVSSGYQINGKNHDLFMIGYNRPNNAAAISVNEMNETQMRSFMKTTIEHFKSISKKLAEYRENNSEIANNVTARLANILRKSIPDMNMDGFQCELKAIAEEVIGDEILRLTEIPFQLLLTASNALMDNTVIAATKIYFLVMTFIGDLSEAINGFVFSSTIETIEWVESAVSYMFDTFLAHGTEFMKHINSFISTYATGWIPIFDEAYIAVCDIFQKLYSWISGLNKFPEKVNQVAQSISDTYVFGYLLDIDLRSVRILLDDIFENILPDSEWVDFRKLLIEFHEQTSSGKLFDKVAKINEIVSKGTSLISSYTDKVETTELSEYLYTPSKLTEYTKNLKTLAKVTNLPSVLALAYLSENTRLPNFNPTDAIPPHQLKGFIADGRHIFSFDGKYLNYLDNCDYVVAQDAVNGNFSIIMKVEGEKPKSLLLYGKEGIIVEVDNSGKMRLNNEPSSFPLVNHNVQGYREGHTFILKSNHGVSIKCSKNLSLCYFKVSGYYHGKLRGLLGNGNNEPFDDLRLPNGEITDFEKDFRKAYSLNCYKEISTHNSDQNTEIHSNASMPAICADIINNDSLFPYCRLVVDIKPYKKACSEAYKTASSPAAASYDACLIAKTYALSCKANGFPASVPDVCIKCHYDGKDHEASQGEVKFELPTNQADIVLLVDTTQPNEKVFKTLVTPMVTKIMDKLKKNKIDNVKLYLVGLTENTYYPIYYDIENESLAGSTMLFGDTRKANELTNFLLNLETNSSFVNTYVSEYSTQALKKVSQLVSDLYMDSIRVAYYSVHDLPLRPSAVKSVILVKTTPCVSTIFLIKAHEYIQAVMQDEGIVAHLISPVNFDSTNDNYKDIIGFNNHDVFMLNAKNSLRSGFEYKRDDCVDFVLSTSGNVYSTNTFNSMGVNRQERFINLVAETISESMSSISYEKLCKCEMGLLETEPKMRCRTVSRTDNRKSEKVKKFKKPSKNTDAEIGRFLLSAL